MNKKRKKKKKIKNKFFEIRTIIMIIFVILSILALALIIEYNVEQKKKNETKTTNVVKEAYAFLLKNDATLIETSDLTKKQEEVQTSINKILETKKYSIDNPYVLVNPYGLNPLSAYIVFNTKESLPVTLTIKGKNNDDVTLSYSSNTDHIIPVYYLYSNYDNKVVVSLSNGTSKELTISIKDKISNASFVSGYTNKMIYTSGDNVIAYDSFGNARLKINLESNEKIKKLNNGNLLISTSMLGTNHDNKSGFIELNQVGEIIHIYNLKNGFHNEVVEDSNGDLYVLSSNDSKNSSISYVNRSTGEIVKEYDIYNILSSIGELYKSDIEINSLTIKDDSLIISIRNLNSIICINLNGELKWIFGSINNWSSSFRKYMLNKSTYLTKFIQGSTSVYYKDNYLYILDNMYDAYNALELNCNSYKSNNSYLRIYSINENYRTIKAIKNIKLNNYSYDSSSIDLSDNMLISLGNVLDESVDTNNYECNATTIDNFNTNIYELDDKGNIFFNINLDYETKNSIYYELNNNVIDYNFSKATRSYSLINQTYEELDDNTVGNYKSSNGYNVSIEYLNNHLKIDQIFDLSSEVSISLLDISGYAYEFKYKEANKYQNNYIDISLIKEGKYFIYLKIDGMVYNINRYIVK